MKYTVIWKPVAEAKLAEIWTQAKDRRAVAQAADTIDRLLRLNPEFEGESRSENDRVTVIEPLAVHFRVEKEDCTVHVLKVWHIE